MKTTFSIENIKEKIDIVEFIGLYIQLKKRGPVSWANCPFHQERTPSFTVNGSKSFFHCFGCGAHGDIFTFLQNYKKISFLDSVKEICTRYKISIPVFHQRSDDNISVKNLE